MLAEQIGVAAVTHRKSSDFMVARGYIFCQAKTLKRKRPVRNSMAGV
jgi:hypothetical protein